MKTILFGLTVGLGFAIPALAQPGITFANNLPALRAPIYGPEPDSIHFSGDWANAKTGNTAGGIPPGTQTYAGALLEGFQVSFWAAPGIVSDGHLLAQGNVTTTLGTGSLAGCFPATLVTFPGLLPGQVATVQVRVTDPDGVMMFGGSPPFGYAAVSALFTVNVTALGAPATGLRSFSAGWWDNSTLAPYVPEPTALSVFATGAAAIRLRRRRKRQP